MAARLAGPSTELGAVLELWRGVGLDGRREELDASALRIAEQQEASAANRKALAVASREWRKAPSTDPEPLLKQFQQEVDNLTKRGRAAEQAFVSLYQALLEAPDPVPALAAAVQHAKRNAELELLNDKANRELEEYKDEAGSIKNQQVTVRRLEERVRSLESELEEKKKEVVDAREAGALAASEAQLADLRAREDALTAQLAEANGALRSVHALHEQSENQLFHLREHSEAAAAAKAAEMDLVVSEADRANERVRTLEAENQAMRAELEQRAARTGGGSSPLQPDHGAPVAFDSTVDVEQRLAATEALVQELQAELRNERDAAAAASSASQAAAETKDAALAERDAQLRLARHELEDRPTHSLVDDLRRQVRALQAVRLGAFEEVECDDEVDDLGDKEGDVDDSGVAVGQSLEALLLEKSRRLEHQLTLARRTAAESASEAASALARAEAAELAVAEQKSIVRDLELGGKGGGDSGGVGEETFTSVLCMQRDRLRARALELEEKVCGAEESLRNARAETEALRADNIALYEKIRYVETYAPANRGAPRRLDVEVGPGAAVDKLESKYKQGYAERINPFQEFHKQELSRAAKEMRPHDRMMLVAGQIIFGNQYMRGFVFFYLLCLHALVFAVMFQLSHVHSCHAHVPKLQHVITHQYLVNHAQDLYTRADQNHDGMLSMAEWKAAAESGALENE